MAEEQMGPSYEGRSRGRFAKFRKAAKEAERNARADLERKGQWPPPREITYKADLYVTIGNPIHEYRVVLTPQR
jgi:hypothetical protein